MSGISEALVRAETFYTIDTALDFVNAETLVIGGKTYTALDTVGTTDGNVHIGATIALTVQNLHAAINDDITLGETGVAGTDYGSSTVKHASVYSFLTSATVLTIKALVPGAIGNHIPCTIGTSANVVDNALLEGGTGDIGIFFEEFIDGMQINGEVHQHLAAFSKSAGRPFA